MHNIRTYTVVKGMCTTFVSFQNRVRGLRALDALSEVERIQSHVNDFQFGRDLYRLIQKSASSVWRKAMRANNNCTHGSYFV